MHQHACARVMSILNTESINPAETPAFMQLDENRLAWLALTLTPSLGPKRILDAVKCLQTPGQIFELTLTELEGLRLPAEAAQFIFDGKARRIAEEEWIRVRFICFRSRRLQLSARGIPRPTVRVLVKCCRGIWRCADCSS